MALPAIIDNAYQEEARAESGREEILTASHEFKRTLCESKWVRAKTRDAMDDDEES